MNFGYIKKLIVPQMDNQMNKTFFNCVESIEVCKQRFENIYIHVECKHLPYLHLMPYFDLASMLYPKYAH
jgi:hypothetical protein